MNCPDDGTCHHECGDGPCFRVQTCEPLSGVYPNDRWPADVAAANPIPDTEPTGPTGHLTTFEYWRDLYLTAVEEGQDLLRFREERDKAYRERDQLVAVLTKLWPSHLSLDPHSDDEDEFRYVVCVHTPMGQATWHIHESELPLFEHLYEAPDHWDGHTTDEKYERLAKMPAPQRPWVRSHCAHRLMVEGSNSVGCSLMEGHLELHKTADGQEWDHNNPGAMVLVPKGL